MQSGLVRQTIDGTLNGTVNVRWEGAFWSWHSLALVNREICRRLHMRRGIRVSVCPTEPQHFGPEVDPGLQVIEDCMFQPLPGPCDVHVRHFYPPVLERPSSGRLVLIQPWEYGYLPGRWIKPIQDNVEEVWCYSNYVRDVFARSAIPEDRLRVIPLGVDTGVFRPEATPYVFTDEPGAARFSRMLADTTREPLFIFLFVGAAMARKGADLLDLAYHLGFSAMDRVVMIVKNTGTRSVYYGATEEARFRALAEDSNGPAVVYLDDDLTPVQLAGLYAIANCVVLPYRGEGFCLPALEAMAAGVPVITTAGGPTDDYVDETVGWRIKAVPKPFGNGRVGDWYCCGPAWMFEPDVDHLCRLMREAVANRETTRAKGEAALSRVRSGWDWTDTVRVVHDRIYSLAWDSPAARRSQPALPASAPPLADTCEQVQVSDPRALPKPPTRALPRPPKRARGKASRANVGAKQESTPEHGFGTVDRRSSLISPARARRRVRPSLGLVMIVRDEERVLGDCLTSAKDHFDEIVVVDTGSVDRTVEIAESFGATIGHFPWVNCFSSARNHSIELAHSDWLCWADADDTFPEECGRALRGLVAEAEDRVGGYIMQVHIPPNVGDVGFTIVDHVKVFRRTSAYRFEGRIHEQLMEPIYRAGGIIEKTNLYLVHSGYDYSPEGQAKKRTRDYTILELDEAQRPDHSFPKFNYGMTLFHHQEFERAIEKLNACVALSKPEESTVRKVYAMLAGCHLALHDLTNARIAIDTGLSLEPDDGELLFRAGGLYRSLGDLAAAERYYIRLLNPRPAAGVDSLDVTITSYKALHNLALLYVDMGRHAEAEQRYLQALTVCPAFYPSLHGLGELYIMMRRFDDARAVLEPLARLDAAAGDALRLRIAQAQAVRVV